MLLNLQPVCCSFHIIFLIHCKLLFFFFPSSPPDRRLLPLLFNVRLLFSLSCPFNILDFWLRFIGPRAVFCLANVLGFFSLLFCLFSHLQLCMEKKYRGAKKKRGCCLHEEIALLLYLGQLWESGIGWWGEWHLQQWARNQHQLGKGWGTEADMVPLLQM